MTINVVNAYPDDVPNRYGGGHWKAIHASTLALEKFSVNIIDLPLPTDLEQAKPILENCLTDLSEFDINIVIFNYNFWPKLAKLIKFTFPSVSVFVRVLSPTAFHYWHTSDLKFVPTYRNFRILYGFLRLLMFDVQSKQSVDKLLTISEWDRRYYWNMIPGKSKVFNLPYYCPWPFLRSDSVPKPWHERKNQIVCIPGGRDPIGISQITNFLFFARTVNLSQLKSNWSFALSPGIYRNDDLFKDIDPVVFLERLDEPWDLLCSVKALAIITHLGFGTKTTIIDALTAGCHVLIDRKFARRLPVNVRTLCCEVDISKPTQFIEIMNRLENEPQTHSLNTELMSETHLVLDKALNFT
ncbi:MAG: hypothetical protein LVS60_13950 [Nodosilinea sp. LVE1205-7]|jgi:hypothetical protein